MMNNNDLTNELKSASLDAIKTVFPNIEIINETDDKIIFMVIDEKLKEYYDRAYPKSEDELNDKIDKAMMSKFVKLFNEKGINNVNVIYSVKINNGNNKYLIVELLIAK